jgi:hypothetical protein
MQFTFIVSVEVNRVEGKFATRNEIADQLIAAIEDGNPGSVFSDEMAEYSVDAWDISEQVKQPKVKA